MSISLHPGTIKSDLTRSAGSMVGILGRLVLYPVSYGAITSLYAGTAPAAGELNGKVSGICALILPTGCPLRKKTIVSSI